MAILKVPEEEVAVVFRCDLNVSRCGLASCLHDTVAAKPTQHAWSVMGHLVDLEERRRSSPLRSLRLR